MDAIETLKILAGLGVGAVAVHYAFKLFIWLFGKFFEKIDALVEVNKNQAEKFSAALQSLQIQAEANQQVHQQHMSKIGEGLDTLRKEGQCKFRSVA